MSTDEAEERRRMIEGLEGSAEPALRMHGRLARLELRLWSDPVDAVSEVPAVTEDAIRVFEEVGDRRGLSLAWHLRAHAAWLGSRARDTLAAVEESLRHAGPDTIELRGVRDVMRYGPLVHGPFTSAELRSRLDGLPERARMVLEAQLAEKEGRFDDALQIVDRTVETMREWGLPVMMVPPTTHRGELLGQQGRVGEALAAWEEAAEILRSAGHASFLSTVLCQKAFAHYQAGDLDEAERLSLDGERLGAEEDVVNYAWGHGVRALVAADRGEHADAEGLARTAVDYAYRTDFPQVHGNAHEALAQVLAAAGRRDEARAEYERALEVWQRYDWLFNAQRVRELLVQL